MNSILMLMCVFGISMVVKEMDGPFGIFAKLRNLIARVPVIGPMFFQVLTCDFCLGGWVGLFIYTLSSGISNFHFGESLVWLFGSATFNLFFSKLMNKLA